MTTTMNRHDEAALIALDWGTTSLRAYLVDAGGAVLDRRQSAEGIRSVRERAFADTFAAEIAYEQLRSEMKPRNAKEMYIAWIGVVRKQKPQRRRA